MFFSGSGEDIRVAFIDWQYTGCGAAMTDLVYFIAMALDDDAAVAYESLLKFYYECFTSSLAAPDLAQSFEDCIAEFKIALLDFQRWQGCARLKTSRQRK